MFQYIVSCLRFSWKKATVYKANLASWMLADLGMYLSTIFVYLLLGGTVFLFAGYNNSQMLLYIVFSLIISIQFYFRKPLILYLLIFEMAKCIIRF